MRKTIQLRYATFEVVCVLVFSFVLFARLQATEFWAPTEQKEVWKKQAAIFLGKPHFATPHPDSIINTAYLTKVREWMETKDYAALEAEAARVRTGGARLETSAWTLYLFHVGITSVKDDRLATLRDIEEWMKQRPASETAQLAWLSTMTAWAWDARGNGYADTITEEGAKLMEDRILKAQTFFQKHPLLENNPLGVMEKLTLIMAKGATRETIFKMGEEAISKFPDYGPLYDKIGCMLLPRWFGQPEDAEDWLKHSTEKLPQSKQDEIYASVALVWLNNGYLSEHEDKVFSAKRLDWSKIRSGVDKLRAKYPKSTWLATNYFIAAQQAGDTDAALDIYANQLRGQYDRSVIKKVPFEKIVDWMAEANGMKRSE